MSSLTKELARLVKRHFDNCEKGKTEFIPGKTKIPLTSLSYGWEEVVEALDSLLSSQVTMGEKVKRFEKMFAEYIGVPYGIMVNSGSSANLLALSILTNPAVKNCLKPGDEVITPAVTWATTVYPIINCGLIPVLVDVDLATFNISPKQIEEALSAKTKAIMLVHLLGNPCDMDRIMEIAEKHHLYLIEDACEAHGAEHEGRKVGSFGSLATFSFFFSHHITTIEGGMIVTNNGEYAELARSLRAFGWARDLKNKEQIAQQHKDIDPRFLFVHPGYNFRPTEIQGAFGIHQIKRLDRFIEIRRENAGFWTESLSEYYNYLLVHEERPGTKHAWFGYPLTVRPEAPFSKKQLVDFLEEKGIETRPIMAGNFAEQPVMRMLPHRKIGNLPNSRFIMRNSFFWGNHCGIGKEEREIILGHIREFIEGVSGDEKYRFG